MSASDASAGRRTRPTAQAAGPTPWACRHTAGLAAALLALAPAAGHAQADEGTLGTMLRACRAVSEAGARMTCYEAIPLDAPEKRAAVPAAPRAEAGFGANQLPRAAAPAEEPERISAKVARAIEREPGIYLLTLADGSEWQFVDSAPASFDPPRAGATVEIVAASLGSYLVRYAGQRAVRARRVR